MKINLRQLRAIIAEEIGDNVGIFQGNYDDRTEEEVYAALYAELPFYLDPNDERPWNSFLENFEDYVLEQRMLEEDDYVPPSPPSVNPPSHQKYIQERKK